MQKLVKLKSVHRLNATVRFMAFTNKGEWSQKFEKLIALWLILAFLFILFVSSNPSWLQCNFQFKKCI